MIALLPLNQRQALTCESSEQARCRCRCNGRYHGARRSSLPEYFERLDETDPHWLKRRSSQLPLPPPVGA